MKKNIIDEMKLEELKAEMEDIEEQMLNGNLTDDIIRKRDELSIKIARMSRQTQEYTMVYDYYKFNI